eukprot:TRINITY_DN4239_c0_g1_i2.p1 TRINITY_DN4239_c0_g1~~TRINITY_DN4239_c0_g1_i2.p1  ORF type:complete len:738 (-),score=144.47 TRINITY_DN4239_c0_g1_i2:41-2254(-)
MLLKTFYINPPKHSTIFCFGQMCLYSCFHSCALPSFCLTVYICEYCSNGYSDPYLCFDFDHFKAFKTEVVKKSLNPKWKFEKEFFYETKYRDRLHKKKLIIECWDWDRVGSDDYIGVVAIDLHTLAHGPTHHNLPLRDNNKPAGRIQFDLYMQEYSTVSINLRNLRLLAPGIDKDTYLEYSYTRIEDKGKKEKKKDKDAKDKDKDKEKKATDDDSKKRQKAITPKAKHVTASEAQFESGPFSVQATLHDLVAEAIRIRVKGGKKSSSNKLLDARGDMRLGPYIANYKVKDQDFTAPLADAEGKEVGRVKGTITIENLPKSAQLIGGEHNEHGCTGQLLLEDIEPPNRYLVKKSTKQSGSNANQTSERIYVDAAHENQYAATDEDMESSARRKEAEAARRRADVANATGGTPDNRSRAGSARLGRPDSSDEDAENEYASFKLVVEDAPDGSTSKPGISPVLSPQMAMQAIHSPQHHPGSGHDSRGASPNKKKNRPLSAELPDPATLPLPPGWERCFDPKTNREYYKNHNLHTTQWQHPEIERLLAEAKARKEEHARNLMNQKPGQPVRAAASQPLQRQSNPQIPTDLLASAPANPIPHAGSQPFLVGMNQPGMGQNQGQQVVFVPVVVNSGGGLPPRGDSNYGAFEPVGAPPQQQQQQMPMLNATYGSTVAPQGSYPGYGQQGAGFQMQQGFPPQAGYPNQFPQQYPQQYPQQIQPQQFQQQAQGGGAGQNRNVYGGF